MSFHFNCGEPHKENSLMRSGSCMHLCACRDVNLKGSLILCPCSREILVYLSLGPESSSRGIIGKEV